jgi:hypothetical protein
MNKIDSKTNKSRWTIIGLFIVFAGPMVIAYSGWSFGWFDTVGSSNNGELIQPVITLQQSNLEIENNPLTVENLNEHWWLVYVTEDATCGLECQANVYLMNQTRTAQAKEMGRVEKFVVVLKKEMVETSKNYLNNHFGVNIFLTSSEQSKIVPGNIYLMDPHGNIMLRYDAVTDEKQAINKGGMIIQDLKKLLKISQIG